MVTATSERGLWPLCQATTRSGSPCRGVPNASGYCPAHREGFSEIAALGGRNKAKAVRLRKRLPNELQNVLALLSRAIEEVHSGAITPAQGSSLAALASSLCKVHEVAELTTRLEDLERRLGKSAVQYSSKESTWPTRPFTDCSD